MARKHSTGGRQTITKWLRSFGYEDTPPTCKPTYLNDESKEAAKEKKKTKELEDEIRQLKQQLEDKRLQAEMYSKMIDIAEGKLRVLLLQNGLFKARIWASFLETV